MVDLNSITAGMGAGTQGDAKFGAKKSGVSDPAKDVLKDIGLDTTKFGSSATGSLSGDMDMAAGQSDAGSKMRTIILAAGAAVVAFLSRGKIKGGLSKIPGINKIPGLKKAAEGAGTAST